MKYLIDCDGVIRKFVESIGMTEQHKSWIKLPDYVWDLLDNEPKKYLYDCNAYEDMIEHVKFLIASGFDVSFLTNQVGVPQREYWTKKFIQKHFGEDVNVIFTTTFQEKIDLLLKYDDAILIDDFPEFYRRKGFNKVKNRIYLMPRIWNESVRHHYPNIFKITDEIWKHLEE